MRNGFASLGDDMTDQEEIIQEEINELEEQIEQVTEEVTEESIEETPQKKVKTAEYNFAELRKQREEDRKELEYERRRNQDMMELLKQSKTAKTPEERDLLEEELSKLQSDDLATVGNAEKLYTKHSKPTKKKIEAMEAKVAQLEAMLEEQRFRAKFPDLDEVISNENIELLKKEEPEVAELLSKMPAGSKEQVTLAYKWIKKIKPPSLEVSDDKKRAIANSKKPMSVQAVSSRSAIGNAQGFEDGKLTKDRMAQYRKEMEEAIKKG